MNEILLQPTFFHSLPSRCIKASLAISENVLELFAVLPFSGRCPRYSNVKYNSSDVTAEASTRLDRRKNCRFVLLDAPAIEHSKINNFQCASNNQTRLRPS